MMPNFTATDKAACTCETRQVVASVLARLLPMLMKKRNRFWYCPEAALVTLVTVMKCNNKRCMTV